MKRIIFSIGTLVMISACLVSCSTEDTTDCPPDFAGALGANEEKLVGKWVLSAIVADEAVDITDDDAENPSTDLFAQYTACERDASYTFNSNRSYTYAQGQNGADCTNKAALAGTWQLSSNTLSFVFACNIQNLGITFSGSEMDFSFSDNFTVTEFDGTTVNTDITFTYTLDVGP